MSKDGGVRRPGVDQQEEGEQATVSLVPLDRTSFVRLRFRKSVGSCYDGLGIWRKEVDCVPEFGLPHTKTMLLRFGANGVQHAVDPGDR